MKQQRITRTIIGGLSLIALSAIGLVGCQWFDHDSPTATGNGDASALAGYAQMDDGSTVVNGHQVNWVVSEWGSVPYEEWMYVAVNEQDAVGAAPGEHQVAVTLSEVMLSFSDLPEAVTEIVIGVKTVQDATDRTFTERGRFPVVAGSVNMPLAYADLIDSFGPTHYSIWFQVIGGSNGNGIACGRIALSGVMPGNQPVTLNKPICFGTKPEPWRCVGDFVVNAATGNDTNACTSDAAPCETIGAALALAAGGETICINPGTYANETWPLTISKTVTLQSTTRSDPTLVTIDSSADAVNPAISVEAGGVAIHDMSVLSGARSAQIQSGAGATLRNCNLTAQGTFYIGGAATLVNTHVEGQSSTSIALIVDSGGTLQMNGGSVTRSNPSGMFGVAIDGEAGFTDTAIAAVGGTAIVLDGELALNGCLVSSRSDRDTIQNRGGIIANISGTTLNGGSGTAYNIDCRNLSIPPGPVGTVSSGGGNVLNGNGQFDCIMSGPWP